MYYGVAEFKNSLNAVMGDITFYQYIKSTYTEEEIEKCKVVIRKRGYIV
jgi:hypothetical protein